MNAFASNLPWVTPDAERPISEASAILLPDHRWHPIKPGSLQWSSTEWLVFVETWSSLSIDTKGKIIQGNGTEVRQAVPLSSVLGLRWGR
jgi:hypothetical protein